MFILAFIKIDVAKQKEDYSNETSPNLLHITHLRDPRPRKAKRTERKREAQIYIYMQITITEMDCNFRPAFPNRSRSLIS